jgi:hypothetical protein
LRPLVVGPLPLEFDLGLAVLQHVPETDLLVDVLLDVAQGVLEGSFKVGNGNARSAGTSLLAELIQHLDKPLVRVLILLVDYPKGDIKIGMDIRDASDVEEGHMETVGFVGVVDRDDIWESLPHLLTKGVGPNEGNNTTLKLAIAVLGPGVGKVLEEDLGRGIATEGLGLRFVHLVLDISPCPDLEA